MTRARGYCCAVPKSCCGLHIRDPATCAAASGGLESASPEGIRRVIFCASCPPSPLYWRGFFLDAAAGQHAMKGDPIVDPVWSTEVQTWRDRTRPARLAGLHRHRAHMCFGYRAPADDAPVRLGLNGNERPEHYLAAHLSGVRARNRWCCPFRGPGPAHDRAVVAVERHRSGSRRPAGLDQPHGELPLVSQVLDLHPASDAVAASSLAPNRKSLAGWRRTGGPGSS